MAKIQHNPECARVLNMALKAYGARTRVNSTKTGGVEFPAVGVDGWTPAVSPRRSLLSGRSQADPRNEVARGEAG